MALTASAGCAGKKTETTNADLLSQYSGDKYEVADEVEQEDPDEGSIDPSTLADIENHIDSVYVTDFQHCLEKEMDRYDNRYIHGTFSIEVKIGTDGKVSGEKMVECSIKETKKAEGSDELRDACPEFTKCVLEKVDGWEFPKAPEVPYDHTHVGEVGEAF